MGLRQVKYRNKENHKKCDNTKYQKNITQDDGKNKSRYNRRGSDGNNRPFKCKKYEHLSWGGNSSRKKMEQNEKETGRDTVIEEANSLELPRNSGCGTGMKSRRRRRRRTSWKIILILIDKELYVQDIYQTEKDNDTDGDMDEVVTATVDLQIIEKFKNNKDIKLIRNILNCNIEFTELFEPTAKLRGLPGPKSTLTEKQIQQLEGYGVITKKVYNDNEKIRNVVKAFTVPKPNGKRRLVVDASSIGENQQDPFHTDLPSIEEIKQKVNKYKFVTQLDGRSWFYQLGANKLKTYFTLRTVLGIYYLVVLAMGWSWSVWIAQTVAVEIASESMERNKNKNINMNIYIDNFIVYSQTKQDMESHTAILKSVADECGAIFKEEDHSPKVVEDILGMRCDFEAKLVCLKTSWVNKFKDMYKNYIHSPGRNTFRTTWKIIGNVMWGMRILEISHLKYVDFKQWMSRTARKLGEGKVSWEDKTLWWRQPLKQLKEIAEIIMLNDTISVTKPNFNFIETLWADASGKGGAYILQSRGLVKSFKWSEKEIENDIHIKEGKALLLGIRAWIRNSTKDEAVKIKTDSTLVYLGLKNKKATGYIFCAILDEIVTLLRGREWDIEWVPTAEQLADKPSRLFK